MSEKIKYVFPEYTIETDCGMDLCDIRTNAEIANVLDQLIVIYQCLNCGRAYTLNGLDEVK